MVSFTLRKLYPWEKGLWRTLVNRLCGTLKRQCRGEGHEKKCATMLRIEAEYFGPTCSSCSCVPGTVYGGKL